MSGLKRLRLLVALIVATWVLSPIGAGADVVTVPTETVAIDFTVPLGPAQLALLPSLPHVGLTFEYEVMLRPSRDALPFSAGVASPLPPNAVAQELASRVRALVNGLAGDLRATGHPQAVVDYLHSVGASADPYVVTGIEVLSGAGAQDFYNAALSAVSTASPRVGVSSVALNPIYCPELICGNWGNGGKANSEWVPQSLEIWFAHRYDVVYPLAGHIYSVDMNPRWESDSQRSAYTEGDDGFEVGFYYRDPGYGGIESKGGNAGLHEWISDMPNPYFEYNTVEDSFRQFGIGSQDANYLYSAPTTYINRVNIIDLSAATYDTMWPPIRIRYTAQYDLDMRFGGCGDECFFADAGTPLSNDWYYPISPTGITTKPYGGG